MNWKVIRKVDIYAGIPLLYLVFFIKKLFRQQYASADNNNYKKILLIKFWGIGNTIMIMPSAHALRKRYPSAQLDCLTLLSNKTAANAAREFSHIHTIDTDNLATFTITTLKNIIALKKEKYDLVIDFEQFARFSALLCALFRSTVSIGFDTKAQHRHFMYTYPIRYNNNIHITHSFYNLAERAGVTSRYDAKDSLLSCEQSDIDAVWELLRGLGITPKGILIVMHIGTSHNFIERRWPAKYFAALADKLTENLNATILFTGLADEAALAKEAHGHMRRAERAFDISGKLNFNQYASLISLCDLVISADTASVHIASALSVPVAGIYGPNTPFLYGPWRKNGIWFYKKLSCSPCITNYNSKVNICRHPKGRGSCMHNISADEVFSGIYAAYFNNAAKFQLKKIAQYA